MIEFATLFLGLYVGVMPVEVLVGDDVAAVELRLDGEWVGEVTGPPWILPCELGGELEPHELVAVARDASGREVGRARQWINVPRPSAEATIVVRDEVSGEGRVAEVSWNSPTGGDPRDVEAVFDGEVLKVTDPRRIPLPAHDPEAVHFLRVDLRFASGVSASAEAVFGGVHGGRVGSDVTAIPLWFRGRGSLDPDAIRGRLVVEGSTLEVVGVEKGLADVVLVPDRGSWEGLLALGRSRVRSVRSEARWLGTSGVGSRFAGSFPRDLRLRVLWPLVETRRLSEGTRALLRPSPEMSPWDAGLLPHLRSFPPPAERTVERIADTVAMAGVVAAETGRRRAVVVVLSGEEDDASRLAPPEVVEFLDHLGVPLFVWSLSKNPGPTPWGAPEKVYSLRQLERALGRVGKVLDRQRVVWVEGAVLPGNAVLRETPDVTRVGVLPFDDGIPREPLPEGEEDEQDAVAVAEDSQPDPFPRPVPPDPDRLERALGAMAGHVTRSRIGSFELHADLEDSDRLLRLAPVAASLATVYRERYGLQPVEGEREVILLYARDASYRSGLGEEIPEGDAGIAGHAGGGLALVPVGDRSEDQLRALVIHELTHLLNRRSFAVRPGPWLEEGVADELALSRFGSDGEPRPGTFWGRHTAREREGAVGALHDLASRALRGGLVPLAHLLDLESAAFYHPDGRQLRYAQSAFLVRYLLEGDRSRYRERFRAFLGSVASGAPSDAGALEEALGVPLSSVEAGFRSWLRFQQATDRIANP